MRREAVYVTKSEEPAVKATKTPVGVAFVCFQASVSINRGGDGRSPDTTDGVLLHAVMDRKSRSCSSSSLRTKRPATTREGTRRRRDRERHARARRTQRWRVRGGRRGARTLHTQPGVGEVFANVVLDALLPDSAPALFQEPVDNPPSRIRRVGPHPGRRRHGPGERRAAPAEKGRVT